MYGATLPAITRNSSSVSGSFWKSGPRRRNARFAPGRRERPEGSRRQTSVPVQLEPGAKPRILRAPRDLVDRVVLQRVDAAPAAQPRRELRHLPARPVVLRLHLRVLVLDRRPVRVAELIGGRENGGPLNVGRVEVRQQAGGVERLVV